MVQITLPTEKEWIRQRPCQLDEAALEDVKNERIAGQRLAVDERGNGLVWMGDARP